jgi:putative SOS response-associated peptidase YedK
MCGRYDLSENPAAIGAHFGVPFVPEFAPSHDVRPTELAPIIRINHLSQKKESTMARWGLVPSWAKDLQFGTRCINARIETLGSVPAFRAAFRNRRCLVPANAFYEWSGPAGRRTRWRVWRQDQPLFALAGLWERWIDPASDRAVETYTIVTTAADETIAPLHDRMPVIVAPDRYADWLDASCMRMDLFVPAPAAAFSVEPVVKRAQGLP